MSVSSPGRTLSVSRRRFLIGSGTAAAGLALYSGEVARHEIDIVRRTVAIDNLPAPFRGYTVAQISDIHLDEYTEPYFLERIVGQVNALKPDLALLTGDFVTRGVYSLFGARNAAYRCAEIVSTLTAPLRYACLGNHDVTVSAPLVIEALTAHGTPVLVNQHIAIERGGERLWLAGVDDPGTRHPDLNLAVPDNPGAPVILMAHEPDYADAVVQHPRFPFVDLMLAGHSHGGQIRVPILGALVLPPMGEKYVEGYFRFQRMQLYVNRGIGTVGVPFRLNCPPEITLLTLQPAKS